VKEKRNWTETADEVVRSTVAGRECWAKALGSKWQPRHFHRCFIGRAGVRTFEMNEYKTPGIHVSTQIRLYLDHFHEEFFNNCTGCPLV
jgi:hypothetical protein